MKELDSKQRAFVLYAAKILRCKDGDELNKKIQALSTDELNQLTTSFDKIYNQQMENSTLMARLGTKLNYIKKLNNRCPEGYEVEVFRAGGKPCMRCKKIQGAIPVAAHKNGKTINDIKSEIAKDKCGSKMKKKKMECGGKTKSMCGGSKMQNGGKAYDSKEHEKLVKDYQSGKIKQGSPQHRRLQELNRSSEAAHDENRISRPSNSGKKTLMEKNKKAIRYRKHENGGTLTENFRNTYFK